MSPEEDYGSAELKKKKGAKVSTPPCSGRVKSGRSTQDAESDVKQSL